MANKKTIPFENIEERLAKTGYSWSSSEYFISPDEAFHPDREKAPFRPDFYILGICVRGWMKSIVDGKLFTIRPYSFYAAGSA